jgi:hypothetical protein
LLQVLANSLEAAVLKSDNSSLAKDCRKEIKGLNSKLAKLGRKVLHAVPSQTQCRELAHTWRPPLT